MYAIRSYYVPFSFFNHIFIHPEYHKQEDLDVIMAHEEVHIRERHWIDLLVIELFTLVFWFNPISWLLEQAIKQNHEYLADQGVLSRGQSPARYQLLLVNQLMGIRITSYNVCYTKLLREVDTIRSFDIETQISKDQLNKIVIIPNVKSSLKDASRANFLQFIPESSLLFFNDLQLITELMDQFYNSTIGLEGQEEDIVERIVSGKEFREAANQFRLVACNSQTGFKARNNFV